MMITTQQVPDFLTLDGHRVAGWVSPLKGDIPHPLLAGLAGPVRLAR